MYNAEKVDKFILDTDPDQSQNLIDWSSAESLSFHKIWFKSVNNFLDILVTDRQRQPERQTKRGYHITLATSLAEVTMSNQLLNAAQSTVKTPGRSYVYNRHTRVKHMAYFPRIFVVF